MPRSNFSIDQTELLVIILALIVGAIYLIYQWITANWNTIILIIEIIIAIGIFSIILFIIYYFRSEIKIKEQEKAERIRNEEIRRENEIKREEQEKAERIRNEEIRRENEIKREEWEKAERIRNEEIRRENEIKSLFSRAIETIEKTPTENWGDSEGIRKIANEEILQKERELKQKEMDLIATLFSRVIETIEKYQPTKKWGNEDSYHKELQGFLKAHFPDSKFEVQTGSSRPDIVIESIAIEIKGPTDNQALQSLADKCLRYSRYYQNMIIVLFEPRFSEGRFLELKEGMEEHFPHVKIIRK